MIIFVRKKNETNVLYNLFVCRNIVNTQTIIVWLFNFDASVYKNVSVGIQSHFLKYDISRFFFMFSAL